MKKLIAFLVFCAALAAQTPTVIAQYDFVTTGGGGTTLTDLSGNGNTGTLHGTITSTATGMKGDGSTGYISLPALFNGLANMSAMVCGTLPGSSNAAWTETGAGNNIIQNTLTTGTGSYGDSSRTVISYQSAWPVSTSVNDFHCQLVTIERNVLRSTAVDFPGGNSDVTMGSTNSGAPNLATTASAFMAKLVSGTPSNFWSGTLVYAVFWNGRVTTKFYDNFYTSTILPAMALRNVSLPGIVPYTGIWQRQGQTAVSGSAANQMRVIPGTGSQCVIVSSPCFRMFSSGNVGVNYYESSDGVNFTAYSSNPVLTPASGIFGNYGFAIWVNGSTMYVMGANSISNSFDLYSSAAAGNPLFSLSSSGVLSPGTSSYDSTGLYNATVWSENGTLYLAYEAKGSLGLNFNCGLATSANNGTIWTKIGVASSYGGPSCSSDVLKHINGVWYLWAHDTTTHIYRRSSPTFSGLFQLDGQPNPTNPTMTGAAIDETSQVANIEIMQMGQITYAWYVALATGVSSPSVSKVAIANMPLPQLVQTPETFASIFP